MHAAASNRSPAALDILTAVLSEYSSDLSAANNEGETPLHLAALHSSLEVVQFLIGKDMDMGGIAINQATKLNELPIHYCCDATEDVDGVLFQALEALAKLEMIVEAAPHQVSIKGRDGKLPLHYIISHAGNDDFGEIADTSVRVAMIQAVCAGVTIVADAAGDLPVHVLCKHLDYREYSGIQEDQDVAILQVII